MQCIVCGKKSFLMKKISGQPVCDDCRKKLPNLELEFTKDSAKELMRYEGATKLFCRTHNLGRLYIDNENGLFVVNEKINDEGRTDTMYVFSVLYIENFAMYYSVRKTKNGQAVLNKKKDCVVGDIVFHCAMKYPTITFDYILRKNIEMPFYNIDSTHISWDEPIMLRDFKNVFYVMVENAFKRYRRSLEEDKPQNENMFTKDRMKDDLQKAMAAFFLEKGYTEQDLRRQKKKLMKTFHPDEGETNDEYAQKINQYYDILKRNLN